MSNRRNLILACLLVVGTGLAYISFQFAFDEHQGTAGNESATDESPDGAVQLSQNVLTDSDHVDPLQPTAPNAQVASLLQPIEAFRRWVETGDRNDSATGLSLAHTRRLALKQLIALDPQEALAHRLSAGQRAKLDPQIASQLEEVVDQFSTYEVIAICGKEVAATDRFVSFGGRRFVTYTYGQRLRSLSQPRIPTHGIAIDDQLALSDAPYRVPDAEEVLPLAAVDGVQVYVGDALQEFSSMEGLRAWERIVIASEQELPSVFGQRTLLFLKIDFSDAPGATATDEAIATSMVEVDRFYRAESANRTYFTATILPIVLRSAKLKSFYNSDAASYQPLYDEATALARQYDAANGNLGTYNPDLYQHVVLLFERMSGYTHSLAPTGWAGIADKLGKRLWLNGNVKPDVIAHELGHNLGLSHAYAWQPTGSSPIEPGTHIEYGDPFDLMGDADSTVGGHFCAPKKRALNYITDTNVQTVSLEGQYRLYRHDATIGTNTVALRIDAGTAYDYWLEYRKNVPPKLSEYAAGTTHGVLIHWNKLPSFTQEDVGTYLLDMTPGSAGGMKDSALTLGQSFYDPSYKIRVTPIRAGSSDLGDWIDVAVALGDYPSNRAPSLQGLTTDATTFARTAVNLTATGSDPDGDTVLYQWDFGDGSPVYTTEAEWSSQWTTGGVFPVAVRAFDAYGGETRQTFSVTVRDPLDAWTRVFTPGLTERLKAVCFGLGKFVAVGDYVSASSADGKVWTRSTSGTSTFIGNAITASASRFVAVGLNYSFSQQAFFTGICTSTDGVTWANVSPSRSETLYGVAYGNGRFIAVGNNGMIWASTDGLQWTASQLVNGKDFGDVQFNGSSFLAVGDDGTALLSADGVTWQDKSLTDANTTADGVSWFKDTGGSGLTVLNGKWTVMTSWAYSDKSHRILWNSDTGNSWSIVKGTYFDIDYTPLKLTSVGGGSTALVFPLHNAQPKFHCSSDGAFWNEKVLGLTSEGSLRGGAEGKGRIVVVGENGQIFVTADGLPALAKQPSSQSATAGQSLTLEVQAYATGPFTYQWRKNGVNISGANSSILSLTSATVADSGHYSVVVANAMGTTTSAVAHISVAQDFSAPLFTTQPTSQSANAGTTVTLTAAASGNPTFQWQKNGSDLVGATSGTLTLSNLLSPNTGLYTAVATAGVATTSDAAIVGISTTSKVIGGGTELLPVNIVHPNGNVFDQILLIGAAETITADAGQVTRTSYVDLNNDIVQVEFAGAGSLSLVLDNPSGPATPVNYYQPTVAYMKGHAGIVIVGADETTNVSAFTVGRATAFDPTGAFNIMQWISPTNNPANNGSPLFIGHAATTYDGVADIAFIAISSPSGKFGGVYTSNAHYFATKGYTGVYAPGVQFTGPVFVGDISAFDAAMPVLMIGSSSDTRITGGDLLQPNSQPVKVSGLTQLKFTAGSDSHGKGLTAKTNRAVLQQNGVDVTAQVVVNPNP